MGKFFSGKTKFFIWPLAAIFALLIGAVFFLRMQSLIPLYSANRFDALIKAAAFRYCVDSRLIKAVIFVESKFHDDARGRAGEIGLMQIMPGGAVKDWTACNAVAMPCEGVIGDPAVNIDIGAWYLSGALKRWKNYKYGIELALCQYNAGESRANLWKPENYEGTVMDRIDFRSTKMYVKKIMQKYQEYCLDKHE